MIFSDMACKIVIAAPTEVGKSIATRQWKSAGPIERRADPNASYNHSIDR